MVRTLEMMQKKASPLLLQLNLRRSNLNVVYVRTYPKIQDIFYHLGGFSNVIIFIATFIAARYNQYKYLMTLTNKQYRFLSPDTRKPRVLFIKRKISPEKRETIQENLDTLTNQITRTPSTARGLMFTSEEIEYSDDLTNNQDVINYLKDVKHKQGELRVNG